MHSRIRSVSAPNVDLHQCLTLRSSETTLKGSITDAGPCKYPTLLNDANVLTSMVVDAVISFGSGLDIVWAGKSLGNIKMDNITVVGDVGGDIEMESEFEVADVDHLTEFTKVSRSAC